MYTVFPFFPRKLLSGFAAAFVLIYLSGSLAYAQTSNKISIDQKHSTNPTTCVATSNSSCIIYQSSRVAERPSLVAPGQMFDRRGVIRQGRVKDYYKINHTGGPLEIIVTENRTRIAYAFEDDRGSRLAVKTNNSILSKHGRPLCMHLPPGDYSASVWTRRGATPYRIRIFRRNFCER